MDKPVAVLTYEHLDLWIASLQPTLMAEEFTCVIGILRGGAPLALMVSHAVGIPVIFLRYERATRKVMWDSALPIPPAGSKILLCEDIAGCGFTMTDCMTFLSDHGLRTRTLTAAYDNMSKVRPDYGIDAIGYFASFPWERHAYTDDYRADWQRTQAGRLGDLKEDHTYTTVAIGLDGVLLPDVSERYAADLEATLQERDDTLPFSVLPDIEMDKVRTVITGRPECERDRTEKWLAKLGFKGIPVAMRDPARHPEGVAGTVSHKTETALRFKCTMFIESDLQQAVLIAERAPLLGVVWWDVAAKQGKLVGVQSWKVPWKR